MCRSLRCVPALALIALVGVLATGTPASAHPFGPPLRATLAADGQMVTLHWIAEEDDWVVLARHIGVFDDERAGGRSATSADGRELTGMERLQRSPRLAPYLLDHIRIQQDGVTCGGALVDVERLLVAGAQLRFDCPREVTAVDVRVTVLTDVHEAYRTVTTTAGGGDQVVTTASEPEQRLDLTATATRIDVIALALATAGLVALGALGLRRRWTPWR